MNNTKLIAKILILSVLITSAIWLTGCDTAVQAKESNENNEAKHEEQKEVNNEDHAGHDEHGHETGEESEGNDMEKPVEELFADTCEHGIKTHACDECRYEVGVAKVSDNMIDYGLVKTGKVETRNFDSEMDLTGEISFDKRKISRISPRVSGIVSKVKVNLGDRVKAGSTLIELESVALAEAQADYLESRAERQLAKKVLDRQQSLREKNITSEREFLEAQTAFESSRIRSNSTRQKLLRIGVSKSEISKLERYGLSSATGKLLVGAPFDGDILELNISIGEHIQPHSNILLIGDTKSIWVWVDLYESQLSSVSRAMTNGELPVSLTVSSYDNKRFSGHLDYVGKVMDQETRTIKARASFDNSDGRLKPGMFAKLKLDINPSGGNAVVPTSAVVADEGTKFAFLHYRDDYFVRRSVKTGREIDGYVEITSGLESGQNIVIEGAFLLKSDVLRSKMGVGCSD